MASVTDTIESLQACIDNPLDRNLIGKNMIAGIVGDAPSHYAKSPPIWNAAFRRLGIDALYLPFDVQTSRLKDLASVLKDSERIMGVNITVPYKVQILDHLDGLEEKADQIKAVNTVVRTEDGRLLGSNTDGSGFLDSIRSPRYRQEGAFMETLDGIDVLMIGAGGSARALAFYLAETMGSGKLLICNRTAKAAESLAREVSQAFGNAQAIKENEIAVWAPKVGLIVNCSTRGQGGIRKMVDGRVTVLEPFSALAPANPAAFPESTLSNPDFYRDWLKASQSDVEANQEASLSLARSIPSHVAFCDLIYYPEETVFLRHGRLTGHRTLNGKGMNVAQAVAAFFNKVCRSYLRDQGKDDPATYQLVIDAMTEAW